MEKKMDYHALHNVNLPELAARNGWRPDTAKSSRTVTVMRNASGGKVIMTMGRAGKWLWRSERDHSHRGDVVDFVKWIGGDEAEPATLPPSAASPLTFPSGHPSTELGTARLRLERIWNACVLETRNGWLDSRGIPASVQAADVFRGTWRTTREGGAAFAYRDSSGLVGIEIRGAGCKRFIQGSQRALWCSRNANEAGTVLLTESPLDAMAHFSLYGEPVGYVALGGTPTGRQLELLAGLLGQPWRRVVAAFDADEAGDGYAALLRENLPFPVDRSRSIGVDWAADLAAVNLELDEEPERETT